MKNDIICDAISDVIRVKNKVFIATTLPTPINYDKSAIFIESNGVSKVVCGLIWQINSRFLASIHQQNPPVGLRVDNKQ